MGIMLHAQDGRRFRNTIWSWRLLWEYVTQNCADILSKEDIEKGDWNLRYRITEEQALGLAGRLDELLRQGRVAQHERAHKWYAKNVRLEECRFCIGTGTMDDQSRVACHVCGGDGRVPDPRSWYQFSEENVRQFATFCRKSGGFVLC